MHVYGDATYTNALCVYSGQLTYYVVLFELSEMNRLILNLLCCARFFYVCLKCNFVFTCVPFLVCAGKMHVSLAEALEVRGGPLQEEEVWAVLSQSAESLQELFHKGKMFIRNARFLTHLFVHFLPYI